MISAIAYQRNDRNILPGAEIERVGIWWFRITVPIRTKGEGEWNARKHGRPKRRIWRKGHIGIDEGTLEIRAVGATGSHIDDAPMLPELLSQIYSIRRFGEGTYDTRQCHDAITDRGAEAIIPALQSSDDGVTIAAEAALRQRCVM